MNCIYCDDFEKCEEKVDVTTTDDLLHGEGVRYVPWVNGCPKFKTVVGVEYGLWREGFAVTGNSGKAKYLGRYKAKTFEEACEKWAETLHESDRRFYKRIGNEASFCGCRIFDNEEEARRAFG